MGESYVELRHVTKLFGKFPAVRDASFTIPTGKLTALLGPSGSGKTTLLRMIAGLESPEEGEILIDGRVVNDIPGSQRGIGFLFQNYALFRYMTVYENIAFGLRVQKMNKTAIHARVEELLQLIGCEGLEERFPNQLSGGQRQRVAFARALAPSPKLLLLDEPFAAVDAKVRQELRSWLRDIITRIGMTSIFVTHDQDEALQVAEQIIVTNQGRIEQCGAPRQLYDHPETPFVAQFVGQSLQVPDVGVFQSAMPLPAGCPGIVRPEFLTVVKEGETSGEEVLDHAVVEAIQFRGSTLELKLSMHGLDLVAYRSVTAPPLSPGEQVGVILHRMILLRGDTVECLSL